MSSPIPKRSLRILRNASYLVGANAGLRVLDFVVLAVASRCLPIETIGVVFFADGAAALLFGIADWGLFTVLVRRVARRKANQKLVRRAYRFRSLAVVCCLVAALCVLYPIDSDLEFALFGFLLAWGIFRIHEMGRAVLAGQERFAINSGIGLGSRTLGTLVTLAGLLTGFGIVSWILGRLLSEIIQLTLLAWITLKRGKLAASAATESLLREGIPFWSRATLRTLFNHVDILLVTSLLGLPAAAVFGIAIRVAGSASLALDAIANAAFPSLSREKNAGIRRGDAMFIFAVALATGSFVAIAGPWIAPILLDGWKAHDEILFFVMAPTIALAGVGNQLSTWLEAKNKEKAVLAVDAVSLAISLGSLTVLLPALATMGAALGLSIRYGCQSLGVLFLAWLISSKVRPRGLPATGKRRY